MSDGQSFGLALWCEADGRILRVIANSLGRQIPHNSSFLQLVHPASMEKGLNFLRDVRENEAAFDWELNLALGERIVAMHTTGVVLEGHMLILAAHNRSQMMQLYNDMIAINNEQSIMLRMALQNQTIASSSRQQSVTTNVERDNALYDEISRLNNSLVNLQRELVKKNQELEKLNAQKNQFLGMASHDLRSPLSAIQAYSEFLLDDTKHRLSPEQIEFVSSIRSSSEFMLNMVNDLLDIATIESGQLQLKQQVTDIVTLVRHNVSLNKVLASAKGIKLELTCDADIPLVTLDPQKIEQVLNNLISNALKYSHPHSTVGVQVARTADGVQLSVIDEGQGIPADEIDGIFQPFVTTSVKSTGGEKSTGLGLMIVRKVVEGHGGKIWVESNVGRGTTISFCLPVDVETAPTAVVSSMPTPILVTPPTHSQLRILLAEDSVVHQQIVLRMLAQEGFTATVATNGLDVLASLQHQPYDVILMDVHMPEMDGLETTRHIRQHYPAARQPHIIAMTASTQQEDRDRCLAAGMNDYIAKPTPSRKEELFGALLQRARIVPETYVSVV